MDKKNLTIGILLILGAIVCARYAGRRAPATPNPAAVEQAAAPTPAPSATPGPGEPAAFVSVNHDKSGSKIAILENSFVQVDLTDSGGAIRDVAFKKYPATRGSAEPFIFNELHAEPILAVTEYPGLDRNTRYDLVSKTDNEVVYRTVLPTHIEVTRRYILAPDSGEKTDPYQIRAETTFRNLTGAPVAPTPITVSVGTAAPVSPIDNGLMLTAGYSTGKSQDFSQRRELEASGGFFGVVGSHPLRPSLEKPGPVVWASAGNQFFVSILTPDDPGTQTTVRRVKLLKELPDADSNAYGLTDTVTLNVAKLAPKAKATVGMSIYVGPKEYHRISNPDIFKADQDKVMQFGTFKFFSALLITLLFWMHKLVPNWGLAIICTTLFLKLLFLPLTLKGAKSARRMQKVQPELKAINEKYKDNPQKKNAATMELFKARGVNPMGGCLPMLIQLPFFWGFFRMLYSSAELRFAPFLWAHDLSAPDTVGHVFGIAINVFPLLLGATSFLQMRLTPQPTVDASQQKMMMFTPLLFLVFCYSYSCALSLYSTTNGIFTIVQQLLIIRMKDTEPVAAPADPRGGNGGRRPIKNVTPGKKR